MTSDYGGYNYFNRSCISQLGCIVIYQKGEQGMGEIPKEKGEIIHIQELLDNYLSSATQ